MGVLGDIGMDCRVKAGNDEKMAWVL